MNQNRCQKETSASHQSPTQKHNRVAWYSGKDTSGCMGRSKPIGGPNANQKKNASEPRGKKMGGIFTKKDFARYFEHLSMPLQLQEKGNRSRSRGSGQGLCGTAATRLWKAALLSLTLRRVGGSLAWEMRNNMKPPFCLDLALGSRPARPPPRVGRGRGAGRHG